MRIAILTPTRQVGGLGETYAALLRQQNVDIREITWIITDDLYDRRASLVAERVKLDHVHLDTAKYRRETPGLKRTLARAYRDGFQVARDLDADLLVSLQDFIIPPDDGVSRFVTLADEEGPCLLTGLMSFSTQPSAEMIVDREDPWTIFGEVYEEMPPIDGWQDIRSDEGPGVYETIPIRFESNWAAVSREVLHDPRLEWDLDYDYAVAFENQDYAAQAVTLGYKIFCDTDNHAVGLPHRDYFPEQEEVEAPLTKINQKLFTEKWS